MVYPGKTHCVGLEVDYGVDFFLNRVDKEEVSKEVILNEVFDFLNFNFWTSYGLAAIINRLTNITKQSAYIVIVLRQNLRS